MKPNITESRLWRKVRDGWKLPGLHVRLHRIEAGDGEADSGTPDVLVTTEVFYWWVELKIWPNKMRPSQVAWATLNDELGCQKVLILVQRNAVSYYLMPWEAYGGDGTVVEWHRAKWTGRNVRDALRRL